eukprot:TRINITY_DN9076_c0_g1_i2.p1 TRINITY_DN9076_c0_g1~~TRINITY_DN9076_c0_g1_i2.p1  ORF type:complete len:253 (+),score=28.76 TRINITY_DN9076_c0_g1_i2:370-1128(+)
MSQPPVIFATAGYDHTIRFWEATTGRCYRTLQYPDSQVNRLEITPDKQYIAAAGNPHIRLFEVNSNSPQPVMSYDSHTNNVMAVGFQCDGNWMYSGSEDGTVKIWDLRAPGCQREYESRAAVNTVVLHPNQTELISGDQNGNIRVWDLTANSCSFELVPEVDTAVRSLTVMWDGSLVVAANNHGTCYVWRLLRGTQVQQDKFKVLVHVFSNLRRLKPLLYMWTVHSSALQWMKLGTRITVIMPNSCRGSFSQ